MLFFFHTFIWAKFGSFVYYYEVTLFDICFYNIRIMSHFIYSIFFHLLEDIS
ncbi:hypothetical protein [Bacillus phage FI_KG-Lek]|nr:hypothetical protein [Bacillus phage FI_KG-Lek]